MTVQIFISGFVQGVGYRQFVKRTAKKIGLTGWVKNLTDGRVEAIFQGDKAKLEKIITFCKKGPFLSEVKDIEVFWPRQTRLREDADTFSDFEILR